MGRIVVTEFISLDGVIEAPGGGEDYKYGGWTFEIDRGDQGNQFKLDETMSSAALLLGRRTYEGFAAAWPEREGEFADRINSMPKYVASQSLSEPLAWNATLLEGDLTESVPALKERHGLLVVSGAGELAHALITQGLVDEFWFWVSPSLWPAGPRIFDGVGPVRLELIGATTFGSGVVRLAYRPAAGQQSSAPG
jgi:dihydrofolate reductase